MLQQQVHTASQPWHSLLASDAVAAVESDHERGLTTDEARERLLQFGPNALPAPGARSRLAVFAGQFRSPLIYLLFGAAAIALSLGHSSDALVIFIVVLLNAVIGSVQEGRAERSMNALRTLAAHKARVVRDGREVVLEARELVPGDVIVMEAGDAVSADARLLHGAALQIAEAPLTGESMPVAKDHLPLAPDTPLADRKDMVYGGTHVTAGRARAVVIATGVHTEIGRIATLASTAKETKTPLERRVAQFGRYIVIAGSVMFVAILAIGVAQGLPLVQVLMVGISQLVGLIPEGLPVAMTIALAVGVQRMARRRTIVRRLAAVETLGSTTVICTDKTGTLTKNEMTVTELWIPSGRTIDVTGVGYAPDGGLFENGRELREPLEDERALLEAGVLCSDAHLHGPSDGGRSWSAVGDPTEIALVTLGVKAGLMPTELRERVARQAELPFDPTAKMMATQHRAERGSFVIVKGAPEMVLALCSHIHREGRDEPMTDASKESITTRIGDMAVRALRVLAIGVVRNAEIDGARGFDAFARRVVLLGLVGEIDPPRAEVTDAVVQCRAAGIRPVMVTGDHKITGQAIARQLDIARPGDVAVDGRELEAMSDDELARRIDMVSVSP